MLSGRVTESVLFSQFRAHYRCESRCCNPCPGNEKGSVENDVGLLRRNPLAPVPEAASEELAGRAVAAGRKCSLTKSVLAEWARRGTPRQVEYLAGYLEAERASRDASKRANLLRRCGLPQAKSFDGYEWDQVAWPDGFGRDDLLSLSFLDAGKGLVLMGDVGTGKTHMAEALCVLACQSARPALLHRLLARRRAGVPPARRRRREAALPGGLRGLRDPARRLHDQPRVLEVGVRLRRRPDGRRRDRPRRPPRQAPAVQGRVLPREARAHVPGRGRRGRLGVGTRTATPDATGVGSPKIAQDPPASGENSAQIPMRISLTTY